MTHRAYFNTYKVAASFARHPAMRGRKPYLREYVDGYSVEWC